MEGWSEVTSKEPWMVLFLPHELFRSQLEDPNAWVCNFVKLANLEHLSKPFRLLSFCDSFRLFVSYSVGAKRRGRGIHGPNLGPKSMDPNFPNEGLPSGPPNELLTIVE